MTDCPNGAVRDLLPDFLNDRLNAERRGEVETHLAGCATCREELSLLRALRASMRRVPAIDADAVAARIPAYRAPSRRRWVTSGRIAAAIAAIAVGGTSITLLRSRTPARTVEVTRPVAVAPETPRQSAVTPEPTVAETHTAERAAPARSSGRPTTVRELGIAGGSIADLSDRELSTLVEGIESLDGMPSAEVETPEPVSMSTQEGT